MSIKDWKNNEISTLLAEAWGFKFNTLQEFDEFNGTGEIQEVSTEDPDIGKKETEGTATDKTEKEDLKTEEADLEEGDKWGHGEHEDRRHKDKEGHETKSGEGPEGHYKDYEGPEGGNKDDKSKTKPGDKDYTWRKGGKSKSHPGKLNKEGVDDDGADVVEEEDELEERSSAADAHPVGPGRKVTKANGERVTSEGAARGELQEAIEKYLRNKLKR